MQCAAEKNSLLSRQHQQPGLPIHTFLHLLPSWLLFLALAPFQGSPFSGHPLSQGILQDQLVPSQAPRRFIPSFVHWVPKPKPILQVSFSPASPAHIAPDSPVGVSEVPPPQPAIAMPCSAWQVLPDRFGFPPPQLLVALQSCPAHQNPHHHLPWVPVCKAYPFCREHQSLLKGVGRKHLEPQELL